MLFAFGDRLNTIARAFTDSTSLLTLHPLTVLNRRVIAWWYHDLLSV